MSAVHNVYLTKSCHQRLLYEDCRDDIEDPGKERLPVTDLSVLS